MVRVSFLMGTAIIGWLAMPLRSAEPLAPKNAAPPLLVVDLDPKLDGKEITVKFTVTGLDGISQLTKAGQAPTFAITSESAKQKNKLSVWVGGELANVLDRLQMSAFQDNRLKAGTVICATGKLTVHESIPNLYFLDVNKWQDFRILPVKEEK